MKYPKQKILCQHLLERCTDFYTLPLPEKHSLSSTCQMTENDFSQYEELNFKYIKLYLRYNKQITQSKQPPL